MKTTKIMGNFNLSGKKIFLFKSPCEKLIITLKRGSFTLKRSCFNNMHT